MRSDGLPLLVLFTAGLAFIIRLLLVTVGLLDVVLDA